MQPISTPSSSSAAAAVEKPELEAVEEPVEKIARDAIAGGACSSSSSSIADSHLVSILSPADQLSPEQNMIIRDHLEKLLLKYVKSNQVDRINEILPCLQEVHFTDENGLTPLYYAAKNGKWRIVNLLMTNGFKFGPNDFSTLQETCKDKMVNDPTYCNRLFAKPYEAIIGAKNRGAIFKSALEKGNFTIARELLDRRLIRLCSESWGSYILEILYNELEAYIARRDFKAFSKLPKPLLENKLTVLEILLSHGANVQTVMYKDCNILDIIIVSSNASVVPQETYDFPAILNLLLDHGYELQTTTSRSFFCPVLTYCNAELADRLLKKWPALVHAESRDGRTALQIEMSKSPERRRQDFIDVLVSHGAVAAVEEPSRCCTIL